MGKGLEDEMSQINGLPEDCQFFITFEWMGVNKYLCLASIPHDFIEYRCKDMSP